MTLHAAVSFSAKFQLLRSFNDHEISNRTPHSIDWMFINLFKAEDLLSSAFGAFSVVVEMTYARCWGGLRASAAMVRLMSCSVSWADPKRLIRVSSSAEETS